MEPEIEFVCPRPRNTRACDKCRARKIRCLPGKRPSEVDTCQRCSKFGYACTYEPASQPTRKTHSTKYQSKDSSEASNSSDDVISGLFSDSSKQADDSTEFVAIHRRAFQAQLTKTNPINTPNQTPDSTSQNFTSHIPSPSSNPNISMTEAENLVNLFKRRKPYFPFLTLPETASAPWLAKHKPFLLVAILTVTSSRTPRLQLKIDERFRRVLSEMIILNGEKSLDYVQGLLVYVAWYPFQLRPLRNQLLQFIQIASTMASELGLAQDTHGQEGRDASLACYNLSSLISSIFQRSGASTATGCLDSALRVILACEEDIKVQYMRLQMLYEQVAGYKLGSSSPEVDFQERSAALEAVGSFYQQLEALESTFSPHARQNIPVHLSRLFLKASIAFLPLKPTQPRPTYRATSLPISPPGTISLAATCFSEIQTFLEALLSTPIDQYNHFSTKEWCQMILAINMGSHMCFFNLASDHISISEFELNHFQAKARAKMLIYLESLAHRMGSLSVSPTHPDIFCMFKSVLGILMPTYAPPSGSYTPNGNSGSGRSDLSETKGRGQGQSSNQDTGTRRVSSATSRCPILNGSIQETDFWRAFEQNTSAIFEDLQGGENMFDRTTVDDVLNTPPDWPSLFSEWVVDFNNVEQWSS